jgi:Ca2+-transporting ATPase
MTVTRVYTAGRLFSVSGAGYNPEGAFHIGGRPVDPRGDADLGMLLRGGLLCSDARLRADGDGAFSVVGDPTEGALVVAAAKGGTTGKRPPPPSRASRKYPSTPTANS